MAAAAFTTHAHRLSTRATFASTKHDGRLPPRLRRYDATPQQSRGDLAGMEKCWTGAARDLATRARGQVLHCTRPLGGEGRQNGTETESRLPASLGTPKRQQDSEP